MKTLRTGLLTILSCAGIASLHAQTADEIISKHLAAIGGKTVLSSMKSMYMEGTMEVMGSEVPDTTWILYGKAFKNHVSFNGQDIIQVATADKGGWMVNPMAGATTPTALPDDQANASKMRFDPAGISGPLIDYASKGTKVEYEGKDTAGGVNYKLKATTKDNIVIEYFVDAKTYNVSKAVTRVTVEGQEVETTIVYSDYKKLDNGYVLSYSQQIILPQITLNVTQKKAELNKTIDPTFFDMPKN